MRPTLALGALFVTCLALELLARALRLPLFPVWIPVLLWSRHRLELSTPALLLYGAAGAVLLHGFWGLPALEFSLAVIVGALALRASNQRWWGARFLLVASITWVLLSVALRPLSAEVLPFELLLTAVFTRGLGHPLVAAMLSALVLLVLVLATLGLGSLVGRVWPRGSALALLLFIGCGSPSGDGGSPFMPEEPDSDTTIIEIFADTEAPSAPLAAHVVLPEPSRTREVCIGCHGNKVRETSLPAARKGIHEIHLVLVPQTRELECTYCHQQAGVPGFPDLTGQGDGRSEYNRRCRGCHLKKGPDGSSSLRWHVRFR